jgi:hypothetical protein
VRADLTTPPRVIPTDWTDLSSRVRDPITIHQGRQRLLDRTEVGQASVPMDNRDGGLLPSVNPNVRPVNHLEIQAVRGGITTVLYRGFVKSWPQEWPGVVDSVSHVQAEDAFRLMARYELENQSIAEMASGAHIQSVLTTFGWPVAGSVPPGSTWWILGHAGSQLGTNTYLGESLRFIDTGQSTIMGLVLTGNLLEHLLNVAETTEGGTFYVGPTGDLVFKQRPLPHDPPLGIWGDGPGELPYVDLALNNDDSQIYNDVRVSRRGDSAVATVKDTTSDGLFGPRTLPISDTLFSTQAQATDRASMLLAKHKDPLQYPVRMVMRPKPDSPLWGYVLGTELGTRITVRRRPTGGGLLETDCLILGITYEISDFWEITWDLAPAGQVLAGYWYVGISGSSELGTTTKLA